MFHFVDNIALKKQAFQKDDGSWKGYASRAVDGNSAPQWSKASCTHTFSTPQPWWAVDLGESIHISSVKITNRQEARKSTEDNSCKHREDAPVL